MIVDEPVKEWMKKPKTGIFNAAVTLSICVHLYACTFFSIFLEHCKSSQTGSPSMLWSLGGGGWWWWSATLSSVWLTTSSCHDATLACVVLEVRRKKDSWADKKWKPYSSTVAWERACCCIMEQRQFEATKSQSWSTMEADHCWLAEDKEGPWMKQVKWVRQSLGIRQNWCCLKNSEERTKQK